MGWVKSPWLSNMHMDGFLREVNVRVQVGGVELLAQSEMSGK